MKQKEFYPEESRIRKSRKTVCSVHGSMFLFCRLKTRIFTLIELLIVIAIIVIFGRNAFACIE